MDRQGLLARLDPKFLKKIEGYTPIEKIVNMAGYFNDVIKVREIPAGANKGPWVTESLDFVGVGEGNPWCLAIQMLILFLATGKKIKLGLVADIKAKAKREGAWSITPKRGYYCLYVHPNGKGHVGQVVRSGLGLVYSIEGNTDDSGGREGIKMCRKVRKASVWDGYVDPLALKETD